MKKLGYRFMGEHQRANFNNTYKSEFVKAYSVHSDLEPNMKKQYLVPMLHLWNKLTETVKVLKA